MKGIKFALGFNMCNLKSFVLVTCLFFSQSTANDFSVTPVTTSSGIYYEKIGEVLLSNSNWQFVTSVDYRGYLLFYEYLLQQAKQIEEFCQTFDSSTCRDRYNRLQPSLDWIKKTDESMANFLGITTESRRVKRFWSEIGSFLKKIGSFVVKTIFEGGSKNVDLSQYNKAIGNLQRGQNELVNQLALQRTIFMIDSEKKNMEIAQLNQNQIDIQSKINSLENSFQIDKEQKEREIKKLKGMLSEVEKRLKEQEEHQKRLDEKVNKIQENLQRIDDSITQINNDVANNKKVIDKLDILNRLNTISSDFMLLSDQFKTEQQILFDVIKNANGGHLDPYVLTPSKLIEMLVNIQADLQEGTQFPYYPNIENAKKLYNIIKTSVYLFDYKIIFILNIPLVYSKTFNINKITSLPARVGDNKFAFILPQEPFLIVDNNYQDYMLMSIKNFNSFCPKLEPEETKHLCQQVEEISHSQYSDECEINLFKSPKQIPETCNKRVIALEKPMFLQLQRENSWIYTAPTAENVIISCNKNRSTVSLLGTGIIHVNKDCTVLTHDTKKLQYFTTFKNPVESQFFPALNLTDSIDLTHSDDIEVKNIRNILPFDFDKLEKASYSTTKTKMKVNLTPLYCALFIILVLVFVFAYLVHKKKITLDKFRSIRDSINMRMHMRRQTQPRHLEDNTVAQNVKLKIKVNNQNDVQDVSIYGKPSETDPDSEYLTVKFKVKKEQNQPSVSRRKVMQNNLNAPPNNLPPKVIEEEYLNELRKIKANKNQNEYLESPKKTNQKTLNIPPNSTVSTVSDEEQYLNELRKYKTKNNQNEPSESHTKITKTSNVPPNNSPPIASTEDQYLNDLRRLKPQINKK